MPTGRYYGRDLPQSKGPHPDPMLDPDKSQAWDIIEQLRAPEGHEVTLLCDNPDFNGQPNCAIEVVGDWTQWEPKRFTGDTMLAALKTALRASLDGTSKQDHQS